MGGSLLIVVTCCHDKAHILVLCIYVFSHAMFFTHPASEQCVRSCSRHQQRPMLDTCWMHDLLRSSSLQGGEIITPIGRVISPNCQALRRFKGGGYNPTSN